MNHAPPSESQDTETTKDLLGLLVAMALRDNQARQPPAAPLSAEAVARLSDLDEAVLDDACLRLASRLQVRASRRRPQPVPARTDAGGAIPSGRSVAPAEASPAPESVCGHSLETAPAMDHSLSTLAYGSQPSSPAWHEDLADEPPKSLLDRAYARLVARGWGRRGKRPVEIGRGGQGVVFRVSCGGADGFCYERAVKVFSPGSYPSVASYERAMRRMARVSSLVVKAQHANVVRVQAFRQRQGIRLMFMDLVDGYDLQALLSCPLFARLERDLCPPQWANLRQVVIDWHPGDDHPHLKPGVAVAIVRDCLSGLHSLHQDGIVHGDIKPSNIMIMRRTGHAEIVDLGSAFELSDPPKAIIQTPAYAAPEALDGGLPTPQSDQASLGYVLIELLTGRRIFPRGASRAEMWKAKCDLPQRLKTLLPPYVVSCPRLLSFCARLISPDPQRRFPTASDADLDTECGAAEFLHELVRSRLASVYDSDIRRWLEAVSGDT